MPFNYIICHYGEIGLKGKNRRFFEERLIKNIRAGLKKQAAGTFNFIKRISGRILIKLTPAGAENHSQVIAVLKNVFGLAYFASAVNVEQKIEKISSACLEILSQQKFKTFKISTRRSEKKFPLSSEEINKKIGEIVVKKLVKKVNLEKPDLTCFIEIVEKFAFIYLERIGGLDGLPVGASGRAAVLLSGGLDSPVAAFYALKRGIQPIFIHFHSLPYVSPASIEKVRELVGVLNKFQIKSELYLIPFGEIQNQILIKAPDKLRVILYRRFMLRLAQTIAQKEKAIALITGEAVGQVASQTLENMAVIEEAIDLPILRPLVGFDKEEIIKKAKEIGTYDISIRPAEDCCVRFLPRHPATKANLAEIKSAEKKLAVNKLVKEAIKNLTLKEIPRKQESRILDPASSAE